jgi:hypothetical protein
MAQLIKQISDFPGKIAPIGFKSLSVRQIPINKRRGVSQPGGFLFLLDPPGE